MNKHIGNPVVYTGVFAEEIKNAFGMRIEIYRKTMGYMFENHVAGLKGKHHAQR